MYIYPHQPQAKQASRPHRPDWSVSCPSHPSFLCMNSTPICVFRPASEADAESASHGPASQRKQQDEELFVRAQVQMARLEDQNRSLQFELDQVKRANQTLEKRNKGLRATHQRNQAIHQEWLQREQQLRTLLQRAEVQLDSVSSLQQEQGLYVQADQAREQQMLSELDTLKNQLVALQTHSQEKDTLNTSLRAALKNALSARRVSPRAAPPTPYPYPAKPKHVTFAPDVARGGDAEVPPELGRVPGFEGMAAGPPQVL